MIGIVRSELMALAAELQRVTLPLESPGIAQRRQLLGAMSSQLRDYLIPRFEQWEAPILIVVGGSTGAGKSTLVNALVGQEVSPASAIRPTTRVPVVVHHPADAEWFQTSSVLPGWVKIASRDQTAAGQPLEPTLQIRASDRIPAGIAIIDAPDIDSLEESNRDRARDLFDIADAWIFVTTAMRYADAVPWEYLKSAQERNAVIMLVLGRTSLNHADEVRHDLEALLDQQGLSGGEIFLIGEKPGESQEKVSESELEPIRQWLRQFTAGDSRDALLRQTAVGATAQLLKDVAQIQRDAASQQAQAAALAAVVQRNFDTNDIGEAIKSGELLRSEVLRQWHEFLGTGEYLRRLEAGVNRVRDRIARLWRKSTENAIQVELGQGFVDLLVSSVAMSARKTRSEWEQDPAGQQLLTPELGLPAADLADTAHEHMRQWQAGILELVREHAGSKRASARLAAYGVNAVGLALMIVAFASTGGLVGAELAIAGGTAVIAQRILEAIFGEQGMRTLAGSAQADLMERTVTLFDGEADRFTSKIPHVADHDLDSVQRALAAALAELA